MKVKIIKGCIRTVPKFFHALVFENMWECSSLKGPVRYFSISFFKTLHDNSEANSLTNTKHEGAWKFISDTNSCFLKPWYKII